MVGGAIDLSKRIVDGDALWRSQKLRRVPEKYRAEYANLIPIHNAVGVFEADIDSIWSDVYSFNRPEITKKDVRLMLDAFEEADMLHRWEENGKVWGTFNGIEKPGRLPPPASINRGDFRIESPDPPPVWARNVEQKQLNAFKLLPVMCVKLLHIRAEKEDWYKKQLKEVVNAYGGTKVVEAFEQWASTKPNAKYPIGDFCKVADGYLSGQVIAVDDVELSHLCAGLYDAGGKTFTGKYRIALGTLMSEFPSHEILEAYKTFIDGKDEYEMKFAVRDFCEGGAKAIISTMQLRAVQKADQEKIMEAQADQMRAEAIKNMEEITEQEKYEDLDGLREELHNI